jgi:hypothetical protein
VLAPIVDSEGALEPDWIWSCRPATGWWQVNPRHVRDREPGRDRRRRGDRDYEVGMQDQAFLGPESGMAVPAEDGGVDIYVATQWLHVDRGQIAPCLGLPTDKVRISLAGVGGAFGAREDLSMQIHAAMLALHTGKPVKVVYSREESFFGHVHRHPARLHYEHGATRDGRLVFVKARIVLDGGAYTSSSPAVAANAATLGVGPYVVPNVVMDSTIAYTNNPPCGAMRGFGAVQACFAYEAQMDAGCWTRHRSGRPADPQRARGGGPDAHDRSARRLGGPGRAAPRAGTLPAAAAPDDRRGRRGRPDDDAWRRVQHNPRRGGAPGSRIRGRHQERRLL